MKYDEICNILRQKREVVDLSLNGVSNLVYIQFKSLAIRIICDKDTKEVKSAECTKFCTRWVKGGHSNMRKYLCNKWLNIRCLKDYESAKIELTRVSNILVEVIDEKKKYLELNKKKRGK